MLNEDGSFVLNENGGKISLGQIIISVINPEGVAVNNYLCLLPGEETSEITVALSITDQDIMLSVPLLLQHRSHERVVKLFGNQIKVYRAPDVNGLPPDDSTFTSLGIVTIDPDQPFSFYTDNAGGVGFWYKFTYLNQTTSAETDISLSEAVRGGGYGHLVSLEDIRHEAGLNDNRRLDDTQVATRRDEAESEINGSLSAAGYVLPLQTGTGVLFVPAVIRSIARILSAGKILQQNFGVTKVGSAKDGKAKVEEARAMLLSIQENKTVLLDSTGQMLAKTSLVSGYPDSTTMDNGSVIGPLVTMSQKF